MLASGILSFTIKLILLTYNKTRQIDYYIFYHIDMIILSEKSRVNRKSENGLSPGAMR
jgi:hypothetical protein